VKRWVCFAFGALLVGLGLLIVPESVRDFRRLSALREANVQVPAEVVRIERLRVPRKTGGSGASPHDDVEDATLRYGVDGTTYTCVARLYLPIGQTKPGDRLSLLYVESDPARCYLPNAVTGSWLVSLLAPVLLLAIGTALLCVGHLLRPTAGEGRPVAKKRRRASSSR